MEDSSSYLRPERGRDGFWWGFGGRQGEKLRGCPIAQVSDNVWEEAATAAAVSTSTCVLCYLDQSRSNNEDFPGWDVTEDKSSCLRQDVSL